MTTYRDAKGRFRRKTREDMSDRELVMADLSATFRSHMAVRAAAQLHAMREMYGRSDYAATAQELNAADPEQFAKDAANPAQADNPFTRAPRPTILSRLRKFLRL